ncbi:hypothetical protein, partial [Clostridioides difficile]
MAEASLVLWFNDADGNMVGNPWIGAVNGPQNGATPKSAFVTVPAGAVVTRYEIYMRASGSGAGSFG